MGLFTIPGMVEMTVAVTVVQMVSLLVYLVVMREFRHIARKYESMLCRMTHRTGKNGCCFFTPNVVLARMYLVFTIILTAGTTMYFLWQPHLI